MPYPTPIEWTDATWNPIGGCSIKSPGCVPCYAMRLAGTRLKHHPLYAGTTSMEKGRPVFNGTMTAAPDGDDVWTWPLRWRGAVNPEHPPRLGQGQPSLIFVADMSDVFHENRAREVQDRVIAAIIHSRHIGQLLTKRPEVMRAYMEELYYSGRWFLFEHPLFGKRNFAPEAKFDDVLTRHLWLGISAERQREFDERWPHLRALANLGFTVFISYEPALGPLHLPDDLLALGRRIQVIAGGTSGNRASSSHPDWFRHVRDQCAAAGVAFFFKQWGEWSPSSPERAACNPRSGWQTNRALPCVAKAEELYPGSGAAFVERVGKKAAGRLLDGREWNEFPLSC